MDFQNFMEILIIHKPFTGSCEAPGFSRFAFIRYKQTSKEYRFISSKKVKNQLS